MSSIVEEWLGKTCSRTVLIKRTRSFSFAGLASHETSMITVVIVESNVVP